MKKILYISLLLLLMVGCKSQKQMVSIDTKTDEAVLKKGQSIEIEFITNASTGYWWKWNNKEEITIVDSVDNRYESKAPAGMVGASAHRFWKFQAVEKGTQTLKFIYTRAEKDPVIKTRDVIITVK